MAAMLGDLDARRSRRSASEASDDAGVVVPANFNCPGQIVISGESAGVERAMELAKLAGAQGAMRLNVSGAFHSPLMEFAVARALDGARPRALRRSALPGLRERERATGERRGTCAPSAPGAAHGARAVDARDRSRSRLLHPDALYVEMGPGSVLKGLVKKIAPDVDGR